MNVALKEANEARYWLVLLHKTQFLSDTEFRSIERDVEEMVKILASIVKSTKATLKR